MTEIENEKIKKVKIGSSAQTTPIKLSIQAGHRLQFQCEAGQIYAVQLPGGFFKNHDYTFSIPLPSNTKEVPTESLIPIQVGSISDYAYDSQGNNCSKGLVIMSAPPDIIIDP
jgi:hypothetical protein